MSLMKKKYHSQVVLFIHESVHCFVFYFYWKLFFTVNWYLTFDKTSWIDTLPGICDILSIFGFLDVECSRYVNLKRFLSVFLGKGRLEGIGQLFRVRNANLRARVALQALDCWPLSACRELLEFCLNDPSTEALLRTDLELKKKELDIYHWVILRTGLRPSNLFLISTETCCKVHKHSNTKVLKE